MEKDRHYLDRELGMKKAAINAGFTGPDGNV